MDIKNLLKERWPKTLLKSLGIEITYIGKDACAGKMPVDERTHQPMGLLHGGASVALAESLASIAAHMHIDTKKESAVGQSIYAHHIRSIRSGYVLGRAEPIHLGKKTQVWEIKITDEQGKLISTSRCTMQIIQNG